MKAIQLELDFQGAIASVLSDSPLSVASVRGLLVTIVQLQLDLWQQLQQAQAEPQMTDWWQLCLAFDEAIA